MLHHISFAVADLNKAGAFYDAALGALGYRRVFEDDTAIGYGLMPGKINSASNFDMARPYQHPHQVFIWRSPLPRVMRLINSIRLPWPSPEWTTASRGFVRTMVRTITQPFWLILTVTISRQSSMLLSKSIDEAADQPSG
jgi:hypothetical protein